MQGLTPTQEGIYFEGKFFGEAVNNIGGYQKYFCELDVPRFARARDVLLRSNDAYRLRFADGDGECRQALADPVFPPLDLVDCSSCADPRGRAMEWIQSRFEEAFQDLSRSVFQDALLKVSADEYWYFAKAHHLMMDGWGFALQMQRFIELYERVDREALAPEDVRFPSFLEYVSRQSEYRGSRASADDLDYWLGRHRPSSAARLLTPREGSGPDDRASSRRVSAVIDADMFAALKRQAAQVGANVTAAFLSVLYVYFSRACNCADVVVSSPVHNRRSANDKNIIGSLVNVNACPLNAGDAESFEDLVRLVARDQKRDHRHSRFPIGDLIRGLRERDGSSNESIHQLAFNYQSLDFGLTVGGKPVETHYLTHNRERAPATFVLCDYGAGQDIALHLDYNCAYFDEAAAKETLDRVHHLLRQAAADFARPLAALSLLTPAERERQLVDWNATRVEISMPGCIDHCFERQAAATPDALAIAWRGEFTTYAEANALANRVAHHLIGLGVRPEQPVCVYLPRTPTLIVALLGILKAGACYVPIDTAYPAARANYILDDSASSVVLTDAAGLARLPQAATRLDVDALLSQAAAAGDSANPAPLGRAGEQAAYVIYTSGSTGQPKGVVIEHRNAVALFDWAAKTYDREDLRAVLAATSVCFDLSVFEMFVPLATGGSVVLADNVLALRDGVGHPVTLINTVPSAIAALLESGSIPATVRCINLAGELLRQELVDAICESREVEIFDLYGPSEDTTYSTCARRRKHGPQSIGRPIHNKRAYVIGEDGGLLPAGSSGELHLAGAGLARGYLGRPELTDERFVFCEQVGERVYRTGDLARFAGNGELQYLGRKDHQVKIRGHRIEPGEIEAGIARHDGVEACAVIARMDPRAPQDKLLVACLVTRRVDPAEQAEADERLLQSLRESLGQSLPDYMMPAHFACLERMPLTSNGKTDRDALAQTFVDPPRAQAGEAPRTETEARMLGLWREVLGTSVAGVGESFFKVGGDSIRLVKLAARIEAEFGERIDLQSMFAHTTARAQAQLVDRRSELSGLLSRLRFADSERHAGYIDL